MARVSRWAYCSSMGGGGSWNHLRAEVKKMEAEFVEEILTEVTNDLMHKLATRALQEARREEAKLKQEAGMTADHIHCSHKIPSDTWPTRLRASSDERARAEMEAALAAEQVCSATCPGKKK